MSSGADWNFRKNLVALGFDEIHIGDKSIANRIFVKIGYYHDCKIIVPDKIKGTDHLVCLVFKKDFEKIELTRNVIYSGLIDFEDHEFTDKFISLINDRYNNYEKEHLERKKIIIKKIDNEKNI